MLSVLLFGTDIKIIHCWQITAQKCVVQCGSIFLPLWIRQAEIHKRVSSLLNYRQNSTLRIMQLPRDSYKTKVSFCLHDLRMKSHQASAENSKTKQNLGERRAVVIVQPLSYARLFTTPWTIACQPSPVILHCLPETAQIHAYYVGDTIYLSISSSALPFFLLPSIFSHFRIFPSEPSLLIW